MTTKELITANPCTTISGSSGKSHLATLQSISRTKPHTYPFDTRQLTKLCLFMLVFQTSATSSPPLSC
uniref:Uncharacterized protein n=1 Tax=Solanum tuberosum TaxID=4113 RepID=M1CW36_SOLTU